MMFRLARRERLHLERVIGILGGGTQTLVHLVVLVPAALLVLHSDLPVRVVCWFFKGRVSVVIIPAIIACRCTLWIFSVYSSITAPVRGFQISVDIIILQYLALGLEEFLSEQQSSDDETVEQEEAVQNVAEFRVVQWGRRLDIG